MKKQLNTIFIKHIIDLDFPFLKTSLKKEKLNSVAARLNLKNKNQFHILDIFKLNNSLKQFIRILHELRYEGKDLSKFLIYIWCSNKYILNLIKIFIKKYKISQYIVLCDLFPTIDYIQTEDKKKFLFVLGDPWTKKPEQMLHARVIYNRIFLVNSLSFFNEKPQLGFYKIQNNLADYKKLIVLLVIIHRIVYKPKETDIKIT